MSTIARHDGWRWSGCSLAGTTLALGESKTLKQRRCAACGGMHVDGERSSPKHGSNLAGKCPPPPQAAGHPTLRDGSTSNGTSAILENHPRKPVFSRRSSPFLLRTALAL